MSDIIPVILFSGCFVLMAIYYCKMVLIWRDVMMKSAKRMNNEWLEVNKMYLQIVDLCDEKPIRDVTYEQMHKRIMLYFKHVREAN